MSEPTRDIIRLRPPRPLPREIIHEVAERNGLTVDDLRSASKKRHIAWARQEAMWELRQRTSLSLPQIAERLNRIDHTTALWGIRAHSKRIAEAQEKAA
jgi:chromosomal replication initiator protein